MHLLLPLAVNEYFRCQFINSSSHPPSILLFCGLQFSSLQRGAIDEKIKKKEEMEQFEVIFFTLYSFY
jgi:hypothetical protein